MEAEAVPEVDITKTEIIVEVGIPGQEEMIRVVDMASRGMVVIDLDEMIRVEVIRAVIMTEIVMGAIAQEEIMTINKVREAIVQEVIAMIEVKEMVITAQGGIRTQIQIVEKTKDLADHEPILMNRK